VTLFASLSDSARDELRTFVRAEVASVLAARDRVPAKRWLTAAEAGTYLGCSQRAIYMRIKRGRISETAVRHSGRSVQIDRVALDRALECA
jgi:excisionase family DNA binding protein